MKSSRILIVDDEPKLVRLVSEILQATGYEVSAACSGDQALKMVALEQPDLILLDILLLGQVDGYEVAKRIREFSDVPIIMLTAKVREIDILSGFDAGADDYITKPFSSKQLLARVRALLKRSLGHVQPQAETEILCGALRIDLLRRNVMIDGREVHLTPTEYNLLHELALHSNQVLFHEHLLAAVWGSEYCDDVDYLRSYVHLLRKKLEVNPADPRLIVSSPGVGYMLVVPENDGHDKKKKRDETSERQNLQSL